MFRGRGLKPTKKLKPLSKNELFGEKICLGGKGLKLEKIKTPSKNDVLKKKDYRGRGLTTKKGKTPSKNILFKEKIYLGEGA